MLGAVTGNPRVRNRSTVLGKLQVAEFSSIIGNQALAKHYGHTFHRVGRDCGAAQREGD